MATKRQLTAIRLDKIAAVDRPCQQHATVAIVKRAPDGPVPPAIAKKTFQEALHAQLVSEKVSDTFWRAFENQWAVRDAFRTALVDEIAEGGDGATATADFTAAMQTIAALAAEAAREATGTTDTDLEAAVNTAISKYLDQQEQTTMKYATKAALSAAVSSFAIAKASAQDVADIRESAVALGETALLPAEGPLAITVAAADPELPVLKRRLDVAEMPAPIRKHFDGLNQTAQDAFIAKSATERQAEVDAIEKGDPIMHTCSDGTVIRKSDGAAVLAMAKRSDTLAAENEELRKGNTAASIEKRAALYPNIAKATVTEMLKSIDTLGADTEAGKAISKSLDVMNKGQSALFKSLGTTEGSDTGTGGDIRKARESFDSKVTEIAKRDGIGRADAMSKARNEFADLHSEAYGAPETEEASA